MRFASRSGQSTERAHLRLGPTVRLCLVLVMSAATVVLLNANSRDIRPISVSPASYNYGQGYLMAGSDGGAYAFGTNSYDGSMGGQTLNAAVVGVADSYNEEGYWLVGSDGGVYSRKYCVFYGSMGGQTLNGPVVGIASTPYGNGYWLVGSDGGIYALRRGRFLWL